LRQARQNLIARKLESLQNRTTHEIAATQLKINDFIEVHAGELIPADGEIVEGFATINEAAVTGESAPVLREAGTDRSGVIGGTKVLTDSIIVQVTADSGNSFLDRMIALVEGSNRQKTPNEIALGILLMVMTLTFVMVVASLPFIASYLQISISPVVLVALLVCLIPTTIGDYCQRLASQG
jgi:K+-transporting ATPase ATPase B chain